MDVFQSLILAIVEGITEFLPISSTGHLVLTSHFLNIAQTDFLKSFEIAIQLGAILAVALLYRKQLLNTSLWPKVIAAFIPTAILGFIFYDFIKMVLLENVSVTLISLVVGGVVLLFIDKVMVKKNSSLNLLRAIKIGLFQSLSMIPGVSRAAATIIGGQLVGLDRKQAVEFSFLLAIPTMTAATGLDLVKSGYAFSTSEWQLLTIGFVGAFVTALVAVKIFVSYVQKHDLKIFGWYRILLAIAYYVFAK